MRDHGCIECISLTPAQMKQIARYELTFRDFILKPEYDEVEVTCTGEFIYTLEDLAAALHNLEAADPTVEEFGEYWFYPIISNDTAFDLDRANGELEDVDDTPEELREYRHLPLSDSWYFSDFWEALHETWIDYEDDSKLSEILDFNMLYANLDRYFSNKGKPITEWEFTDNEKGFYVDSFERDERVKQATENELILARRMIDELCAADDEHALHIKGYACYGGNRLYGCDWPTSRDCILRLFEKTDNPQYANTLGYIFYYGRCTGGEPEYEKAFYYFGISAANGLYEGMYKLADMFYHGYGCKKSENTARRLYGMVYDDSYIQFVKGHNANFADAALRMGNVFSKGIGCEANISRAYEFYTQADYAARIRAENSDFFGNRTVVINIQKSLEEIKEELPEDYFCECLYQMNPFLLELLTKDRYKCELKREKTSDGEWKLTGTRLSTRSCESPECILLSYPRIGLCERTTTATMTTVEVKKIWFKSDSDCVRYDSTYINDEEERFEFYYDDELTAWIVCDAFCITGKTVEQPHGQEYCLVTIRFSANGRTYDYICDIEDVQVGDTVIIDGYDGETAVEVVGVRMKRESELGLPVERYKKIKGKMYS